MNEIGNYPLSLGYMKLDIGLSVSGNSGEVGFFSKL